MEDCCVVCAEPLEWVAYGSCGHRDVCATCIIRLRFICDDRSCCICKSHSDHVFVTKALGDYMRRIADFGTAFGNDATAEGKVGEFWYYAGAGAYFDDVKEYEMVKAMCNLSCNVCDKKDDQTKKRVGGEFRSIEQLKRHLFHRHKLFLCSLCLESRKVFISEQKLYDREQLSQHVRTGDSVVNGSESDRGGFKGHPMCKFCQNPFYGDNELFQHMSTEHFTCHICKMQHPEQYEYYENYDNLEIHFRQAHFLCEDDACLAKKFVVFTTESEMKRHETMEHGGLMSRSKRSAALQIPTSFQFRSSNGERRHGRGRGNHSDVSDNQCSMAIQDSLETANVESSPAVSSRDHRVSRHRESSGTEFRVNSFESLSTSDTETSSRYRQGFGQNFETATREASSFPPLPVASSSSQRFRVGVGGLRGSTMAARLQHRNTVKVLNSSQASGRASNHSNMSAIISSQSRPVSNSRSTPLSCSVSSQSNPSTAGGYVVSSNFASSSRTSSGTSKASQSARTSSNSNRGTLDKHVSTGPPILSTSVQNMPTCAQPSAFEDVQSANKALVEKIHFALEFDEDKYSAFKIISADYRQDLIGTAEYLAYVHQFGLSHLILELARLCPNFQKQRELLELYNYNMRRNGSNENGQGKCKKSAKKGKEKCEDNGVCSLENASSDGHTSLLMTVQSNSMPSREETEVSSQVRHSSAKGKSKVLVNEQTSLDLSTASESKKNDAHSASGGSNKNVGAGGGGNKPRKKTPKFLRNRLGDASALASADSGDSDAAFYKAEESIDGNDDPSKLLPVRGVWQNGGGRRLVARTQKSLKK